jgi:hypothetical protein
MANKDESSFLAVMVDAGLTCIWCDQACFFVQLTFPARVLLASKGLLNSIFAFQGSSFSGLQVP